MPGVGQYYADSIPTRRQFSSLTRSSTQSIPYFPTVSSYSAMTSISRPGHRPFRSRFLKSTKADYYGLATSDEEGTKREESRIEESTRRDSSNASRVLNNGAVLLKVVNNVQSNDEDSDNESATNSNEEEEELEEEEDPLDIEEQELIKKLSDKESLSYAEECDLRKRLFDVKTIKFKRNQSQNEDGVVLKFKKMTEEASESKSVAKEEEKKILVKRLQSCSITEIEQKDIQVRLQEILRDQKVETEESIRKIENHYEHILQETTTELTEIESSIRGKRQLVEKLQDEILSLNVRKEILNEDIESLHSSHQSGLKGFEKRISQVEEDISKYSVLLPPSKKSSNGGSNMNEDELKELESELECPVCMDISKPPIYQCEEGHIICSNCKPLLRTCPHCSSKYSEPAIRCRFAEKLSIKYFSISHTDHK